MILIAALDGSMN